jgi:predicted CopG family antitoxin
MPKPVMLSDEAYRVLRDAKRPGESFSDVVLRKFPKGDPARILAAVKEIKPDLEFSKSIKEARKEMRKNVRMKEVVF